MLKDMYLMTAYFCEDEVVDYRIERSRSSCGHDSTTIVLWGGHTTYVPLLRRYSVGCGPGGWQRAKI